MGPIARRLSQREQDIGAPRCYREADEDDGKRITSGSLESGALLCLVLSWLLLNVWQPCLAACDCASHIEGPDAGGRHCSGLWLASWGEQGRRQAAKLSQQLSGPQDRGRERERERSLL
jgi:hypothetical protein